MSQAGADPRVPPIAVQSCSNGVDARVGDEKRKQCLPWGFLCRLCGFRVAVDDLGASIRAPKVRNDADRSLIARLAVSETGIPKICYFLKQGKRYAIVMKPPRIGDSSETNRLLRRAASGEVASWGKLLTRHEERLRRMVAFRLDPRLRGRVDASDVMQEIHLEAARHLPDYLKEPGMPLFLWLRGIAGHKLLEVHRHHLGTPMRDARREIALYRGALPGATSAAIAAQLLGHATRPSEAAMRAEAKLRLQDALNDLDPLDREILALRHIEQLTNAEAARVLGIKEGAAGKRYLRALERLREILRHLPGGLDF
jgi:RNA polymerase sigma-70 factor (ECF subfamily)